MVTAAAGVAAGQIESVGEPLTETDSNATNTQAFTAGNVLARDTGTLKWRKCTSGDIGPFVVCTKDKAETDTRVEFVRRQGVQVYVIADGAINPNSYVMPATATDGQVIAFADAGTTGTKDNQRIGIYLKRAAYVSEGHGSQAKVACADADIIKIELLG
jgi:hypothetical protein